MLSRLHRRAEALDGICLRAWGHPNDYSVRQELLNALEWDRSLHPEHARASIRERFKQVHDHSTFLSHRLQSSADNPAAVALVISLSAQSLRRSLATLMHVLETRHAEPRTD